MVKALDARKLDILKLVVDRYIRTGEPVGSKTIAEALNNSVSSATIRNEMADLEAMGLLDDDLIAQAAKVDSVQSALVTALAVSGQTDPAVLTACFDDWQACRPLLASLVRHAELDQIDTIYRRAIQAARNHDQNEARLQVAELSGALRHIAEMEFPSLHNIL